MKVTNIRQISSYFDLSDFVTSLQHILHTWVLIKLSLVLTQFKNPIQDIVFEETEFFEIVACDSKLLAILKGPRVILFEVLEGWFRVIFFFLKVCDTVTLSNFLGGKQSLYKNESNQRL